jgi:hypothetical protein
LFVAKAPSEYSHSQIQLFDRAVAIAQARVEFAFAKREDVEAQLEALLVEFREAWAVPPYLQSSLASVDVKDVARQEIGFR